MSAVAKKDSEISNLIMYKNEENRIKKLLKTKNVEIEETKGKGKNIDSILADKCEPKKTKRIISFH